MMVVATRSFKGESTMASFLSVAKGLPLLTLPCTMIKQEVDTYNDHVQQVGGLGTAKTVKDIVSSQMKVSYS